MANNVRRAGGSEGCLCEVCGGELAAKGDGEELGDEECGGEGLGWRAGGGEFVMEGAYEWCWMGSVAWKVERAVNGIESGDAVYGMWDVGAC